MRYAIIVTVLSLVLGASFAEPQSSDPNMKNEAKPQSKKISVADFGNKNVIGHLGHPLGTVVHVTGIAVDGKTTRMKRDMGKTLLEIHTVNGEKLKTKASFEFRRAPNLLPSQNRAQNLNTTSTNTVHLMVLSCRPKNWGLSLQWLLTTGSTIDIALQFTNHSSEPNSFVFDSSRQMGPEPPNEQDSYHTDGHEDQAKVQSKICVSTFRWDSQYFFNVLTTHSMSNNIQTRRRF